MVLFQLFYFLKQLWKLQELECMLVNSTWGSKYWFSVALLHKPSLLHLIFSQLQTTTRLSTPLPGRNVVHSDSARLFLFELREKKNIPTMTRLIYVAPRPKLEARRWFTSEKWQRDFNLCRTLSRTWRYLRKYQKEKVSISTLSPKMSFSFHFSIGNERILRNSLYSLWDRQTIKIRFTTSTWGR